MITKATKDLPEIEWEKGDCYDTHDHYEVFGASGESADGRKWIGTWGVCDGQFDEITDIEEVES